MNAHKTSDPMGSFITSQAIIEHGTIKLDAYKDIISHYQWQLIEKNDHLYYYFPFGSAVFAIPFVALTRLVKMNATKLEDEIKFQAGMSAVTVSVVFILLFLLSSCYLNYFQSLLISSLFVFGTSIMSSMGVAFWSINLTTVFILLSLLLIARYETEAADSISPYFLGIFLFSAFFCRPTAATFILTVFFYLFWIHRSAVIKTLITSGLLLLIFVIFSLIEFGRLLPDYYFPQRVGDANFVSGLYGTLFSSSRGLFIYSSFLILVFFGALLFLNRIRKRYTLILLPISWFMLHLITLSNFQHWWGGGGIGARLFTEIIPGFALVAVLLLSIVYRSVSKPLRGVIVGCAVLLSIPSIVLNTGIALYNTSITEWEADAFFDRYPEYLFSWRYPQFRATQKLIEERDKNVQRRYPQFVLLKDTRILHDGSKEVRTYNAQDKFGTNIWRDFTGFVSDIVFEIDFSGHDESTVLFLDIIVKKNNRRKIRIILNGNYIGDLPQGKTRDMEEFIFTCRKFHFRKNNILRFKLPGSSENPIDDQVMRITIRTIKFLNQDLSGGQV